MTIEELESVVKIAERHNFRSIYMQGIKDALSNIIHCKDCKHYSFHCSWNGEKRYWCELGILYDGENGFCSHGAKMDDEGDE